MHAIVSAAVVHPCERVPSLPREFGDLVLRALAREPARRFPSVDELGAALYRFAGPRAAAVWAPVFGTESIPTCIDPETRDVSSASDVASIRPPSSDPASSDQTMRAGPVFHESSSRRRGRSASVLLVDWLARGRDAGGAFLVATRVEPCDVVGFSRSGSCAFGEYLVSPSRAARRAGACTACVESRARRSHTSEPRFGERGCAHRGGHFARRVREYGERCAGEYRWSGQFLGARGRSEPCTRCWRAMGL